MLAYPSDERNPESEPTQVGSSMDLQQMQAMVAMAAGMANGANVVGGAAMGTQPQPSVNGFPGVDPMMAQAYAQMFAQFVAVASATPGMSAGVMAGATAPTTQAAPSATIQVAVEGMQFQYQLTDDDLLKVFSRYGSVQHIQVNELGTSAHITFAELSHAQAAMQDLNGKVLNGLEGTLRIVWASQLQPTPPPPAPPTASLPSFPMMPPYPAPAWGFPTMMVGAPLPTDLTATTTSPPPQHASDALAYHALLVEQSTPTGESQANSFAMTTSGVAAEPRAPMHVNHVKGARKYTCRFLIGIDEADCNSFQVVRRIIGTRGGNMKHIVNQTEAKLRLRGVGSGYLEGAGHKESSEPLQLCVSCTTLEGFEKAVEHVKVLLDGVYEDYRNWRRENGLPLENRELNLHASPSTVGQRNNQGVSSPESPQEISPESEQTKRHRKRGGRKQAGRTTLKFEDAGPAPGPDEIQRIIDLRNEARRQGQFAEADKLRSLLQAQGVALMDEPGARGAGSDVTTWRYEGSGLPGSCAPAVASTIMPSQTAEMHLAVC